MVAKKKSVFVAYQLAASDAESDGSADEHTMVQKEKQKLKKKARAKKKNSDNATLKDLAMCSTGSKKKTGKAKGKAKGSTESSSPSREASPKAATNAQSRATENAVEDATTHAKENNPANTTTNEPKSRAQSKGKAKKATVNGNAAPSSAHNPPAPLLTPPPPTPAPAAPAAPASTNQTHAQGAGSPSPVNGVRSDELGAIYSPTEVTITRADGQASRVLAVSEIMDQLVMFQNQNNVLRHMNQQDKDLITKLQSDLYRANEMIFALRNEVSRLHGILSVSLGPSQSSTPGPSTSTKSRCPPPPGLVQ